MKLFILSLLACILILVVNAQTSLLNDLTMDVTINVASGPHRLTITVDQSMPIGSTFHLFTNQNRTVEISDSDCKSDQYESLFTIEAVNNHFVLISTQHLSPDKFSIAANSCTLDFKLSNTSSVQFHLLAVPTTPSGSLSSETIFTEIHHVFDGSVKLSRTLPENPQDTGTSGSKSTTFTMEVNLFSVPESKDKSLYIPFSFTSHILNDNTLNKHNIIYKHSPTLPTECEDKDGNTYSFHRQRVLQDTHIDYEGYNVFTHQYILELNDNVFKDNSFTCSFDFNYPSSLSIDIALLSSPHTTPADGYLKLQLKEGIFFTSSVPYAARNREKRIADILQPGDEKKNQVDSVYEGTSLSFPLYDSSRVRVSIVGKNLMTVVSIFKTPSEANVCIQIKGMKKYYMDSTQLPYTVKDHYRNIPLEHDETVIHVVEMEGNEIQWSYCDYNLDEDTAASEKYPDYTIDLPESEKNGSIEVKKTNNENYIKVSFKNINLARVNSLVFGTNYLSTEDKSPSRILATHCAVSRGRHIPNVRATISKQDNLMKHLEVVENGSVIELEFPSSSEDVIVNSMKCYIYADFYGSKYTSSTILLNQIKVDSFVDLSNVNSIDSESYTDLKKKSVTITNNNWNQKEYYTFIMDLTFTDPIESKHGVYFMISVITEDNDSKRYLKVNHCIPDVSDDENYILDSSFYVGNGKQEGYNLKIFNLSKDDLKTIQLKCALDQNSVKTMNNLTNDQDNKDITINIHPKTDFNTAIVSDFLIVKNIIIKDTHQDNNGNSKIVHISDINQLEKKKTTTLYIQAGAGKFVKEVVLDISENPAIFKHIDFYCEVSSRGLKSTYEPQKRDFYVHRYQHQIVIRSKSTYDEYLVSEEETFTINIYSRINYPSIPYTARLLLGEEKSGTIPSVTNMVNVIDIPHLFTRDTDQYFLGYTDEPINIVNMRNDALLLELDFDFSVITFHPMNWKRHNDQGFSYEFSQQSSGTLSPFSMLFPQSAYSTTYSYKTDINNNGNQDITLHMPDVSAVYSIICSSCNGKEKDMISVDKKTEHLHTLLIQVRILPDTVFTLNLNNIPLYSPNCKLSHSEGNVLTHLNTFNSQYEYLYVNTDLAQQLNYYEGNIICTVKTITTSTIAKAAKHPIPLGPLNGRVTASINPVEMSTPLPGIRRTHSLSKTFSLDSPFNSFLSVAITKVKYPSLSSDIDENSKYVDQEVFELSFTNLSPVLFQIENTNTTSEQIVSGNLISCHIHTINSNNSGSKKDKIEIEPRPLVYVPFIISVKPQSIKKCYFTVLSNSQFFFKASHPNQYYTTNTSTKSSTKVITDDKAEKGEYTLHTVLSAHLSTVRRLKTTVITPAVSASKVNTELSRLKQQLLNSYNLAVKNYGWDEITLDDLHLIDLQVFSSPSPSPSPHHSPSTHANSLSNSLSTTSNEVSILNWNNGLSATFGINSQFNTDDIRLAFENELQNNQDLNDVSTSVVIDDIITQCLDAGYGCGALCAPCTGTDTCLTNKDCFSGLCSFGQCHPVDSLDNNIAPIKSITISHLLSFVLVLSLSVFMW